ncbi:caspase-3-like [Saccostrea cucullata]|uniref:caspase-3-like n=1 Tax=Saccostrea cuccullata TaxID=36930 RepID=UPI002ED0BD7A
MSGSSVIVKISKERYESSTYKTTPGGKGHLCKPVILDIRKTHFGLFSHERPSASRDVELLTQTFQKLPGFHPDPYVISDKNSEKETDPLYSVENLKKELKNIASNEEITKDSEIFVCVVLAFGESGYFYLPNDPIKGHEPSKQPPKFSVNDLLLSFKGNHCPHLILKPKVFLIQTCNPNLDQINKANFAAVGGLLPQIQRTPIEADILIYQSTVSGGYTDKMKKETKEGLGEHIDHGETTELKASTDHHPACQFVYALYNEVKALTDTKQEFELTDLLLSVNSKLEYFIKKEHYKSDEEDTSWNIEPPEVPVCIDQLTKKLVLNTR